MESIKNKVFERKYPSSGCIFFPLGLLMLGLIIIIILASISKFNSQNMSYQDIMFVGIPIMLVIACLAYFCFSRTFARIPIGIYPTHIIIDNRKYPWLDIKHIVFHKSPRISNASQKVSTIQINLNKKKYVILSLIVSLILIIPCLLLLIALLTNMINVPSYGRAGRISGLLFLFPIMFGINIIKPGSRRGAIEPKDFKTVFNLTKYYAEQYNIPLEYKEEK